jgi:broad specificity phosphatase PhoE
MNFINNLHSKQTIDIDNIHMEILLIRHGKASGDTYAEPMPPAEGFLSEEGMAQARELGVQLRGEKIDLAWTSPYGRAVFTAHLALEGRGVPTERFSFLREWLPAPELAKADSAEWEKMNVASAEFYAEQTWKTDLGEGCLDMLARVGPPFLKELEKVGVHARHGGYVIEPRAENLRIAVFAHGGSLSALMGFLLNIPPFPVSRFSFELTGMARVRMQSQQGVWYPQLVIPTHVSR